MSGAEGFVPAVSHAIQPRTLIVPVQPRHLAWLRYSRKHLPLFCGALLGNPSSEGLIETLDLASAAMKSRPKTVAAKSWSIDSCGAAYAARNGCRRRVHTQQRSEWRSY